MPYEKQIFVNGEVLTAEQLNHMEDGISTVTDIVEKGGGSGEDGFSPVATVQQTEDGATIKIIDKNGTTTAKIENGYTPVRGVDYFTPEDVADIVADTKAQIAAGERYALIETITTTEAVNEIKRTVEPDGTPYYLSRIMANIYVPTATANFSAYVYGHTGDAMSYIPNTANSTGERYSRVVLDVSRGYVDGHSKEGGTRYSQSPMVALPYSYTKPSGPITMFRITGGTFPAGTKIDIYGVRL